MLTPKQEAFCIAYIELGNASDAYRKVYNAEKMKGATINRNAKALLENNRIATRLTELRDYHCKRHNITVDDLIRELDEVKNIALEAESPQTAAAISAIMGKAKILGMDKPKNKKINIEGYEVTDIAKKLIVEITSGELTPEHGKLLMDCLIDYSKIDKTHSINILRETMKRKIEGEVSALEAAQIIESEGINVPKTLTLEVQKEIGGTGENISDILTNLGDMLEAGRKRRRDAEK